MSSYSPIIKFKLLQALKKAGVITFSTIIGCWLSISICQVVYSSSLEKEQDNTVDLLSRGVIALEKLVVIEENE